MPEAVQGLAPGRSKGCSGLTDSTARNLDPARHEASVEEDMRSRHGRPDRTRGTRSCCASSSSFASTHSPLMKPPSIQSRRTMVSCATPKRLFSFRSFLMAVVCMAMAQATTLVLGGRVLMMPATRMRLINASACASLAGVKPCGDKLAASSCGGAAVPHEELRENFVASVATAGSWGLDRPRLGRLIPTESFAIS